MKMLQKSNNKGENSPKYEVLVDDRAFKFEKPTVTRAEILTAAGKVPLACHSLYQKLRGCDFEIVYQEDNINLANPEVERFVVKEPVVFPYSIDGEPELTDQKQLTPQQILLNSSVKVTDRYLVLIQSNNTELEFAFKLNEPIVMSCAGLKFVTRKWVDSVDIEQFGKGCIPVPPAKQYKVRVDKDYFNISEATTTARALLKLANKNPAEKFDIFKITNTNPQPKKVGLDDVIDLRAECLVRFVTLPKEQQDGWQRREFSLPFDDTLFLNAKGLPWETFSQGSYHWLVIDAHPVPTGYNITTVKVALMIPPNYPATEIDMVYFFPELVKKNGRPISGLSPMQIENSTYQRWSRHRSPGEWRPGLDDVSTHLLLVNNWLEKDLNR